MIANQKMYDGNGKQVALFPLVSFIISQADTETYSHNPSRYWATDYLGYNESGNRVYRAPCYAPVDIKLIWFDASYPVAVWESLEKVHLANNMIDYLTILVYHDNDYANGVYHVGDIKRQGEIFNKTGTMNHGQTVGDHMHLETGYGRFTNPNNHYHIENSGGVNRLHNYDALFINDTIPRHTSYYPTEYPWKTFQGGSPTPPGENKEHHFPWVLYARKLRDKRS